MTSTTYSTTQWDFPKVRILVVGDSGVGKTSLIHKFCHDGMILDNPIWTTGCNVEVKLFYHKASEQQYFIEFWDVGGSRYHVLSRSLFYTDLNGILLMFDLSNRKSYLNLKQWRTELVEADRVHPLEDSYASPTLIRTKNGGDISPRQRQHQHHHTLPIAASKKKTRSTAASMASPTHHELPKLAIGNKTDLVRQELADPHQLFNTLSYIGVEGVFLSAADSSLQEIEDTLEAFVTKVIERRYFGSSSCPSSPEKNETKVYYGTSPLFVPNSPPISHQIHRQHYPTMPNRRSAEKTLSSRASILGILRSS